MLKVLSGAQIRALEAKAAAAGIPLSGMMENAGAAAVRLMRKKFDLLGKRAVIVCGKGNNGGDGYVCARLLTELSVKVTVILAQGRPASGLAAAAFAAMPQDVYVIDYRESAQTAEQLLAAADYILDGLFGFGFHGSIPVDLISLVRAMNASGAVRVSLDLPSGAQCDNGAVLGECVCADYTVTFSTYKPVHVLAPGRDFCGEVVVSSVGIPAQMIAGFRPALSVYSVPEIKALFPPRPAISNKGDYGKLLCICGSVGMAGAAVMAGAAALRCGTGLVQMALPESIYPIVSSRLTEPVFTLYRADADGALLPECRKEIRMALSKATAVLIGCGLGKRPAARELLQLVLREAVCPVLFDADGINLASENIDMVANSKAPVVLTPHPGEMARLMDLRTEEVQKDRIDCAAKAAQQLHAVVVLKGSGTVIAAPDGELILNTTGNPGMAKGGSGDVLAGMIAALLAQGMDPTIAAAAGAYLHGLAGDRCAERYSEHAMLPTDLVNLLPEIFLAVER